MKIKFTALVSILIGASIAFPADPFNYFVEVKNFSEKIYREKLSRFRLASSDADFILARTPFQKIIREYARGSGKIIEIEAGDTGGALNDAAELSGYLVDTRFLNIPAAVEIFVYDHITDKTMGIPLVPALHVYRSRRGDCTEHAVLSVSLLRALGVPSRAVVGMYLAEEFMGRKNIFVYHMWAEAYHGGAWRMVDATRPGAGRHNRYIAFAYHTLKTESPLSYLRAVSAISNFSAEYLAK